MDADSIRSTMSVYVLVILAVLVGEGMAAVKSERRLETYENHPCLRKCRVGYLMNCAYDFTLEYYYVLTKACYNCPHNMTDCFRPHCVAADGVKRGILTVNRMLPGPGIHVCQGDTVIVNVHNELVGAEGTSIHWHGLRQRGSPHMDGVSMITQCPIPAKSSFRYRFIALDPGTHFWHAHSGLQRSDGLYGAFVVRQSDEFEPHLGLYDVDSPDYTMIVNDWLGELSVNRFAHHHHAGGDNKPRSILINGRGMLQEYTDTNNVTSHTPLAIYHVTKGRRYRFRTISNGIMNCPIQVSIDSHNLTMIASDGNAFKKTLVQSFNIFAGERFDFVLDATSEVGNYWIRARGFSGCDAKQAKQVAVLRYEGALKEYPTGGVTWAEADRLGTKLNPWNEKSAADRIAMSDLTAMYSEIPPALRPQPNKRFYLAMDFNKIDNFHFHDTAYYPISAVERPKHLYLPQINHITNNLPSSPPLSQYSYLDKNIFCDETSVGDFNCTENYCQCTHRLKISMNDVVEIVMIDEGVTFNTNHPMHIHGYNFYVVGMDRLNESTSKEDVMRLDKEGMLPRNLTRAIAKDTVTVSDGGYTILRFYADNPGVWFFHCHIEFHADIGMGLVIQVGEPSDMPKPPKHFPKCGHWHNDEMLDGNNEDENSCKGVASALSKSIALHVFIMVLSLVLQH